MRGKGEGAVFKDKRTGYWTAVIELPAENGTRKRKFIRRKVKRELLEALAEQKQLLKSKGFLPDATMTAEQWFAYWLELASKEVRPNTWDGYMRIVKNHVVPVFGTKRLSMVTSSDIERVLDKITVKDGLSSTTALLAFSVMALAFKAAVKKRRIVINPMDAVAKPRKKPHEAVGFDLEEALAVLEHVSHDDQMGARWAMALLTGARRGEVLGLEVDKIHDDYIDISWQLQRLSRSSETGVLIAPADFEYRHLYGSLYLTRPKTGKGQRTIRMFEPLKTILQRHIDATGPNAYGLVFTNNGKPIDPTKDSKNWRRVLAETGIEKDVVLHGLRHTAVDLLFLAGMPEDLIKDIVGHSTVAMSRAYLTRGKVVSQRMDASLATYSALFSSLGGAHSDTPEAAVPSPQALEQLEPGQTSNG